MPSYGRYQVAEAPSQLLRVHLHDGAVLKPVTWDVPIAVLDQEDLNEQGIICSQFITGAGDPDALGSCTANTAIEAAATILTLAQFSAFIAALLNLASLRMPAYVNASDIYQDTRTLEIAAIVFYHACTFQTGNPAVEWPTVDCGSSGPYIIQLLAQMSVCTGSVVATGADNIISLLQQGPLLMGGPFLNAWEQPAPNGLIDGNGSVLTLARQLRSGIAGGHETLVWGIDTLALYPTGSVNPHKTVLDVRNHWTRNWGDQGNYKIHLSTIEHFQSQFDLRRAHAAARRHMTKELDCEINARDLLERRGRRVAEIVRVNPDSILYLDGERNPCTGWLLRPPTLGKPVELAIEPGFAAVRTVAFTSEQT